jgi:hypothetical protein
MHARCNHIELGLTLPPSGAQGSEARTKRLATSSKETQKTQGCVAREFSLGHKQSGLQDGTATPDVCDSSNAVGLNLWKSTREQ